MSIEPDELLRRLSVLSEMKAGMVMPEFLGGANAWAQPLAELFGETVAELQRLRIATIYHTWQPISTAPVLSVDEIVAREGISLWTFRFRCLIQMADLSIQTATARYAQKQGRAKVKTWELRWYGDGGAWLQRPKYWMPLPAAKED